MQTLKPRDKGRPSISPMRIDLHQHAGRIIDKYGKRVVEAPFSEMDLVNQKIILTKRKRLQKQVDLTEIDVSQLKSYKTRNQKRETTPSCDLCAGSPTTFASKMGSPPRMYKD